MTRRVIVALLVLAGSAMVVLGGQRWLDNRAATKVVKSFIAALIEGDRDTALSHLTAEQRSLFERKADAAPELWTPAPAMKYRVHHVEMNGETARVQIWMDKDGFVIEPVFHLRRTESSSWKIERIEKLEVDPRWHDVLKERARLRDAAAMQELSEALKHRRGVKVERTPMPGTADE